MATLTLTAPFSASIPNPGSTGLSLNNFFQSGPVTGVSLTLTGLDHTFLNDLDILLVSPDDRKLMVMSDVGGNANAVEATITLRDSAAQALPTTFDDRDLEDGSYRPTTTDPVEALGDFGRSGSAIQQATGTGAVGFASTFNGGQSTGAWWLHVNDDAAGAAGVLASWSLTLTTADSELTLNGTTTNDSMVILSAGASSGTVVRNGQAVAFSGVDRFTLYGGTGDDLMIGGNSADTLYGGDGADLVYGGAGNDFLGIFHSDSAGRDSILDGGAGTNDRLVLNYGNIGSTIDLRPTGLAGLEQLFFFQGPAAVITRAVTLTAAQLQGFTGLNGSVEAGSDVIDIRMRTQTVLDLGFFAITGMTQTGDVFRLRGDGSAETITGSAALDIVFANDGDDTLFGGGTYDFLYGGNGNDRLAGGAGDDSLDGGAGSDMIDYSASAAGVTVRLWNGTGQNGDAQGDALTGIEHVTGSALGDSLIGDDATGNWLTGGGGADYLGGLGGGDRLNGQSGNDTLEGGNGADQFVFGLGYGHDRVVQFVNAVDRVDLVGLTFGQFTEGAIAGGVRLTGTGAAAGLRLDLMGVTIAQVEVGDFI